MSTEEVQVQSGLRKTAILLVQMGPERSAKILSQLRESEVEEITSEIVRLRNVNAQTSDAVLSEFHKLASARAFMAQGGAEFAREMLETGLGNERANEIMERLKGA